jgi:uncharacterized protein YkwD
MSDLGPAGPANPSRKQAGPPGSDSLGVVRATWFVLAAALPLAAQARLPDQRALEAALRESVAASCPSVTFALDPELGRAAQAFARAAQAGRAPVTGSALGFYAALESAEPAPMSGVAIVSPPSRADRAVGDLFPRECRFNRAGVAASTLPGDRAVVALVTAAHTTDLAPIPGHVEVGAALAVDATLAPALSSPRLFLLRPGGEAEEQHLNADGNRVRASVTLPARGEYTLEVLATGPGGPQVAAIRRIFAGVEPPDAPPPEKPRSDTGVSAVEHAIARLRATHGLPALQRDRKLDAVAEAHSREMARTRTFAHVLPSDGSMSDRLRKAGYAYRSAGENIGLSIDALSAHEAVASSPAHLANLLDPYHRRLGLGAAKGVSPDGAEGVYLTEVMAAPIEPARDPQGEVARLLHEKRRALGLRPLARDDRLDALAAEKVRALASSGGEPSVAFQRSVVGEVLRAAPGLRSAVAEMYVASGADATRASANAAERNWTRLGIGAVYANSDTYGSGRLWVLLVYAR